MAQKIQPLLWVTNTAPFVIGFIAAIVGRKQDELQRINEQQEEIIASKTESLRKNNTDLSSEIERRKVIELNLIEAKEEADEARHAEERFLAIMSHEIRTPLNSIIGFTRLHADIEMSEKQNEYLRSVQYSSNHLLAIINDILELSKIKAGQIEFEEVKIGLKSLLTNVMDTIRINAENKGLDLELELDSELRFVGILGDPVRMGQVLLNLLNNAIKFTSNGGVKLIVNPLKGE